MTTIEARRTSLHSTTMDGRRVARGRQGGVGGCRLRGGLWRSPFFVCGVLRWVRLCSLPRSALCGERARECDPVKVSSPALKSAAAAAGQQPACMG